MINELVNQRLGGWEIGRDNHFQGGLILGNILEYL